MALGPGASSPDCCFRIAGELTAGATSRTRGSSPGVTRAAGANSAPASLPCWRDGRRELVDLWLPRRPLPSASRVRPLEQVRRRGVAAGRRPSGRRRRPPARTRPPEPRLHSWGARGSTSTACGDPAAGAPHARASARPHEIWMAPKRSLPSCRHSTLASPFATLSLPA